MIGPEDIPRMNYVAFAQVLVLVTLVNGGPLVAKRLIGNVLSAPLDANAKFFDGRPLFGSSKTIRGVIISLLTTCMAAPLLGLEFRIGLLAGAAAMGGDLPSSFLKRRLRVAPSSRATVLDQLPESLLPFLACQSALTLSATDIAAGCVFFFVGEILLSHLFFRVHLRDRPY